jgi:hypothetical protein
MKQFWKKIIDNATNYAIKHPYLNAAQAVLFVLMAGMGMWRDHGLVGHVLRFAFLFLAFVHIYFLARAVDRLGSAVQSLSPTSSWECILSKCKNP